MNEKRNICPVDIYSKPGTPVVFMDYNGYEYDTRYAKEKGLVEGETYFLNYADIHSSSTDFTLEGIEGYYNSVMFCSPEEWEKYKMLQ